MRILERSVYVGPSLYAHFPVIRLELDLGALERGRPRSSATAFVDGAARGAARAWPSTAAPTASRAASSAACARTRAPGSGHVLEHVAIELQNVAGEDVTFGKTRSIATTARACTAWSTSTRRRRRASPPASSRCKLLDSLLPAELRTAARVPDGLGLADARATSSSATRSGARSGPSTASLVRAAEERDIPWLRLNQQSLVQLGHGKYQQRIQATVTGQTPHIAVELASDKEETNKILGSLGLPVPRQELVQPSQTDALRAARKLGYPVVTKPLQRQPRPRHLDRPAPTDDEVARRLRRRARAFALGDRRDLRQRRRPPPAGGQRRAGRGDRAHARPRGRRRQAAPSPSWSRS